MRFSGGDDKDFVTFIGSATMVSPYYAITAGHNFYLPENIAISNKVLNRRADQVSFSLAFHEGQTPFPTSVSNFMVHDKWVNDEAANYDYALLRLEHPVGEQSGYASLKSLESEVLRNIDINVTGYPGDRFVGGQAQMYTMHGRVKHLTERKLFYEIDTSGGQSGSGVWSIIEKSESPQEEDLICCGVHTTGAPNANGAIRVTNDFIDNIKKWIRYFHVERK